MRPVVIVVVLPLAQLLIEQVYVVGYAVSIQQLVELLIVDAMRPFDFAVQVRCPRADINMPNVLRFGVPVKLCLELRTVVGLDDVYAEQSRCRTSSRNRIAVR